jgi:hypothetical protein
MNEIRVIYVCFWPTIVMIEAYGYELRILLNVHTRSLMTAHEIIDIS